MWKSQCQPCPVLVTGATGLTGAPCGAADLLPSPCLDFNSFSFPFPSPFLAGRTHLKGSLGVPNHQKKGKLN